MVLIERARTIYLTDVFAMQLTLKLFGSCILQDASGNVLRLPTRKTRALLAYLAVHAGTCQPRERLMDLLWSDRAEPQARQSLNAALNALRKLARAQGVELIESDRESVGLIAEAVDIDASKFLKLKNTDPVAAAKLYKGPFMDGFASPDDGFDEWLRDLREQLHREACSTLKEACASASTAGNCASAISFAERCLELDPLQEDVHREVIRLYLSAGNRARAMRQYENCVKLLQKELGVEPSEETQKLLTQLRPDSSIKPSDAAPLTITERNRGLPDVAAKQHVQFCSSSDGTRIAYAQVGAGKPILKAPNFLNHLEYEWGSPIWNAFLAEFARQNTLVRFDQRGTGLSDWDVGRTSIESMIEDMEAVVKAADLGRFALLGISQGAGFSIQYAALHPDQVSCIIILGGFARGRLMRDDPDQVKRYEIVRMMIREGWGSSSPIYRNFFTANFLPDAPLAVQNSFDELQRVSCNSENALRIAEMNNRIDVVKAAKSIQAPALIFHNKGDRMVDLSEGQELARLIPDAVFVELPGENHLALESDTSFNLFFDEVRLFLSKHTN